MKDLSQKQEWIILSAIAFLFFMEMLDGSILNTSFPQIAFSLGIHPIELKVALTSYLLSLGVLIPISGWMADKFGVRNILIFAITVFMIGSVGCGFAHHLSTMVTFRIIQGLGGSFMGPVGRLVILRVFGKSGYLYAMMRSISFGLVGSMMGPLVGGALTTYASWRWIFFINIPFCIVPIVLVLTVFPSLREKLTRPFDALGFVFFGSSLGILLYVVDVAAAPVPSPLFKASCLIASGLLLLAYGVRARKIQFPMLNMDVLKEPIFKGFMISGAFFRLSFNAFPFAIPLMLQVTQGFSAFHSGLIMVAMPIGSVSNRIFLRKWIDRFGFKGVVRGATQASAFLAFLAIFIPTHFNVWVYVVWIYFYGMAIATVFGASNTAGYSQVKPEHRSMATSMFSTMQQVTMCFSIALAALLLELLIGHQNLSHYIPPQYFRDMFVLPAVLSIVGAVLYYRASAKLKA